MLRTWLSVIHPSWQPFIDTQLTNLNEIVEQASRISPETEILPAAEQVLRCLSMPLTDVKVLIVGQDPYPNAQHACGLAFAVGSNAVLMTKSLKNIQIELVSDLGCPKKDNMELVAWHEQGVMLLNRVLTVNIGKTNSHSDIGWQEFTLELIRYIDTNRQVVAILWGNSAISVEKNLVNARIVKSAHPSPLSAFRGFFGSKPFSKTNDLLMELDIAPIDWCSAMGVIRE
jgi:uracil-DNA glycosylase